jgi:putative transposase
VQQVQAIFRAITPPSSARVMRYRTAHPRVVACVSSDSNSSCVMAEPRKKLRRWETCGFRYLTFSTFQRLPLLSNPRIRDLLTARIERARSETHFRLSAWVIMPEHVHIILAPDSQHPVPHIMRAVKQEVAERTIRRWRDLNAAILPRITDQNGRARFWQRGGGFDRNIRDENELLREIAYIHNNPVTRGLVASPTDWAWSSARWYAGDREHGLQIDLPWGRTRARYDLADPPGGSRDAASPAPKTAG